MPRFGCRCGHSIPLHAIPCEHEARLVWDADRLRWDELQLEQWTQLFDARDRGAQDEWLRGFYGPPARVFDSITGREDPPGDRAATPLPYALFDIARVTDTFSRNVVRCPECARLYIQRGHRENGYDCYRLEPDPQPDD